MKITVKSLGNAANASSGRGTGLREFRSLILYAGVAIFVLYLAIVAIVDISVPLISFETEARLFKAPPVPNQISRAYSDELARANDILSILLKDESIPPLPYSVSVVEGEEPNAFAFAGGAIGFTEGMIGELDDELAIAYVIGHELGHFHNRDQLRSLGRIAGITIVSALVFGGQGGKSNLGGTAFLVLDRQYSRSQEDKADLFALELLHRTYGKTEGFEKLFSLLDDSDQLPRWAYMFATHPSPKKRIAHLRQEAESIAKLSD